MKAFLPILIMSFFFTSCSTSPPSEKSSQDENDPQEESLLNTIEIVGDADTVDISLYDIVGLPCPNSSTYAGGSWTYEEAEARKDEIYDMALTPKYFNWKNPTSGGAIHINKNDEIEVYQFTFGIYQGTMGDTALVMGIAAKDTFVVVSTDEVGPNVQGVGFGNETSILITSEMDLTKSKSFPKVLEELFHPGDRIYYLKSKKGN
ncbi:MAG: hypothetical protein AB8B56_19675 [Crocinitomicaceae bacterium]